MAGAPKRGRRPQKADGSAPGQAAAGAEGKEARRRSGAGRSAGARKTAGFLAERRRKKGVRHTDGR